MFFLKKPSLVQYFVHNASSRLISVRLLILDRLYTEAAETLFRPRINGPRFLLSPFSDDMRLEVIARSLRAVGKNGNPILVLSKYISYPYYLKLK